MVAAGVAQGVGGDEAPCGGIILSIAEMDKTGIKIRKAAGKAQGQEDFGEAVFDKVAEAVVVQAFEQLALIVGDDFGRADLVVAAEQRAVKDALGDVVVVVAGGKAHHARVIGDFPNDQPGRGTAFMIDELKLQAFGIIAAGGQAKHDPDLLTSKIRCCHVMSRLRGSWRANGHRFF